MENVIALKYFSAKILAGTQCDGKISIAMSS